MENNWAEEIPKDVMTALLSHGEGHTIFGAEELLNLGLHPEIVDKFKTTLKSDKVPKWDTMEEATVWLWKELEEWAGGTTVKFSLEDLPLEAFLENMVRHCISEGKEEFVAYSPKGTIFVKGQPVDEMDGIYDLVLVRAIANNLGLSWEPKMGRGFEYRSISSAIKSHLESLDVH
tara:strand:- start:6234 stop:6758 length:525 start_codon:yes stop_codon:yes gene_type:complete